MGHNGSFYKTILRDDKINVLSDGLNNYFSLKERWFSARKTKNRCIKRRDFLHEITLHWQPLTKGPPPAAALMNIWFWCSRNRERKRRCGMNRGQADCPSVCCSTIHWPILYGTWPRRPLVMCCLKQERYLQTISCCK